MGDKEMESLKDIFKNEFDIGAAVTPALLKQEPEFIVKHYNSLTAENEMKFISVHPEREKYDFTEADEIVQFARDHHIKVRGHNLIWHQQTPDWVFKNEAGETASRDDVLKVMAEHIDKVVKHFSEDVYCWDVVNEAIDDGKNDLRKSKWLDIVGEDFIEKAFRLAHKADPKALLFYNDYNAVKPDKCEKICRLAEDLIEKGVPIHGVGIQGHWNVYWPKEEDIRAAIEKYIALGLKVQITELDVSMYGESEGNLGLTQPTSEMLELQAARYESFFRIFREYKEHLTAVTFWGVADDYTWLDNFPVRKRKNWPFVFDEDYKAKLSFEKLENLAKR